MPIPRYLHKTSSFQRLLLHSLSSRFSALKDSGFSSRNDKLSSAVPLPLFQQYASQFPAGAIHVRQADCARKRRVSEVGGC